MTAAREALAALRLSVVGANAPSLSERQPTTTCEVAEIQLKG
ncbi:hypothetical protein ACIRD6_14145 [Streptomyces sp. NPDC102473]